MRKFVPRWLNDAALRNMGDSYEGIVAEVLEQPLRNKFTATRELQPVIRFTDGWRLVPNISMRRTLIEALGPDSEGWLGRRIMVNRRCVERTDSATGETREAWQKTLTVVADTQASARRLHTLRRA